MTSENGFPRELLAKSDDDKILYFKEKTIGHPFLLKAHKKIQTILSGPAKPQILLLIGPSGSGKSTLGKKVVKDVVQKNIMKMEADPAFFPIPVLELLGSETEKLDWIYFYKEALKAVIEPDCFIGRKTEPEIGSIRQGTLRALKESFLNALQYRKAEQFILDEAHTLILGTSPKVLEKNLKVIKSLAMHSKTTFILIGTYELRLFRNLNEELSRRSVDIHFQRYKLQEPDLTYFKSVIATFQKHLPFEEEPDLLEHWEFLYERSIGCIGVLKDWLLNAYTFALANNEKTIGPDLLRELALSEAAVFKMLRTAMDGERAMENLGENTELRAFIGLDKYNREPLIEQPSAEQPSARSKSRSYNRSSKRDVVGDFKEAEGT